MHDAHNEYHAGEQSREKGHIYTHLSPACTARVLKGEREKAISQEHSSSVREREGNESKVKSMRIYE